MKIIGLISSPNINGNGAALVREALRGAKAQGAITAEIFLPANKLEFCKGCMSCMVNGGCIYNDDFNTIRNMLGEADGIILCSPTYAGSINSMMKLLVERLGMFERFTSSIFGGKYIAGISTCSSMGAVKTANEMTGLAKSSIFKRSFVSGSLGVSLGGKQVSNNPKILKQAYLLGKRMAADIKTKRAYPLQNLPGRLINNLVLKPAFRNIILKLKDSRMKGVYTSLRSQNLI